MRWLLVPALGAALSAPPAWGTEYRYDDVTKIGAVVLDDGSVEEFQRDDRPGYEGVLVGFEHVHTLRYCPETGRGSYVRNEAPHLRMDFEYQPRSADFMLGGQANEFLQMILDNWSWGCEQ